MAETWLKCTACKNPIAFGATHWVCSVSTCNRSNRRYVFCTVSCWDSHVAQERHRDAWAVEAKAPSKEGWDKELADSPGHVHAQPAKPAPAPAPRRVVGDASPTTAAVPRVMDPDRAAQSAAGSTGNVTLTEVVDKDVLIVVSKMKKYIKDRSGMNCSDAVAELLSDHVRAICDDSIRAAARDERKTVLDRDVPKARR
jgi:hypothetical protein